MSTIEDIADTISNATGYLQTAASYVDDLQSQAQYAYDEIGNATAAIEDVESELEQLSVGQPDNGEVLLHLKRAVELLEG